jgi:dihydrofolate reductase
VALCGTGIIVYIATSADGYIARADGSVDWLDRPRPPGNDGWQDSIRTSLNPEFIDERVSQFAKRLRQTKGKTSG